MKIIEEIILEKINSKNNFVIATVVDAAGSVPGKINFKMIVTENETYGTVGGGGIEKKVIDESRKRLLTGQSGIKKYLLSDTLPYSNEAEVVNMMCNGEVVIYYNVYTKGKPVYIFGGGNVGNALLYFLKPLKFNTKLIDCREVFANKEANPNADEILFQDYIEYASTFNPEEDAFIVVLTHSHKYDLEVVRILFQRNLKVKYIGVIGSSTKAATMLSKLKEEFPNSDLSNIHSPIGIKMKGDTAEEIALSISAQMQSLLYS